jgi:hypothetical protein
MFCSPCGTASGSNYTSVSTLDCVTLCGAGISTNTTGVISTFIVNPFFSLSSLNISTFTVNVIVPSAISTFVSISDIIVNFGGAISTNITNPNLTVNIPSTISTFLTNSCISLCGAGISTTVTNPISTFVTNSNLSVNVANFPSFYSTAITNFPLSFSTFVTNSNLSVNVANFPSFYSTAVTNFPLSFSTNISFPSSISTTTTITGGSVTIVGAVSTNAINATLDVFHQLLVDTPTTTYANHHAFTAGYETVGYVSTGTGSVFVDISNTLVQMTVSGSGGRVVEQSLEYQLYQPGKGHVVCFTLSPQYSGTFDNSVAVRAGIYDDYRDKNTPAGTTGPAPFLYQSSIYGGTGVECNQPSMGHFFELSGNQWFVVERYNSDNNINNVTRVAQADWNSDTVNGNPATSPSGFVLNATSPVVLFFIERQWLGVGIVRMGLYADGVPIYCHVFGYNPLRTLRRPYTHLNKLPIRYEIEKVTGGSSAQASMAAICASGQIGGNYITLGNIFSIPAGLLSAHVRVGITELRPVLMIRLQQQYCRATFKLLDIELFGSANGFYSVFRNAVVSGTITWIKHPDPNSMMEYAYFPSGSTSTRTVTNGYSIRSGFYSTRTSLQDGIATSELITRTQFSADIEGNPDVCLIAMGAFTANTDVNANMRWIEIV